MKLYGSRAAIMQALQHKTLSKNSLQKKVKTRHDLGREEFLKVTWDWANKHKDRILEQCKLLGASFDLSRKRFTLDEGCSKAVKKYS